VLVTSGAKSEYSYMFWSRAIDAEWLN